MPLINFADIQNLDDATPQLWNSRYGAILNLLNGYIDSTNLADSAVTTAKLAPGSVTTDKIADASITNQDLANNAIILGTNSTTAGEITYTAGTFMDVSGMTMTITTTRSNQIVIVTSRLQTYKGGYTSFQYTVDGTAVGNFGKVQTGVNSVTTGYIVYSDYISITTPGSHVIRLQANAQSADLRIIHAEGPGRMFAISG